MVVSGTATHMTTADAGRWLTSVNSSFERLLGEELPNAFSKRFLEEGKELSIYSGAFEDIARHVFVELHLVARDPGSHMSGTAATAKEELEGYYSDFVTAAREAIEKGDPGILKSRGYADLKKAAELKHRVEEVSLPHKLAVKEMEPESTETYLRRILEAQEKAHHQ